MNARNKFLTEAMDHCWHESVTNETCDKCGITTDVNMPNYVPPYQGKWLRIDFSTWQGFGLLWEWVISQEWYWHFDCHLMYAPSGHEFTKNDSDGYLHKDYINPDKFADAVYEYLKNKN